MYGAFGKRGCSYGAAEDPATEGGSSWTDTLAAYSPAINALVGTATDPCKLAAKHAADLEAGSAKGWSLSRMGTLRAKYEAETEACQAKRGQTQAATDAINWTNIAIGSAAALALAGTFAIIVKALR